MDCASRERSTFTTLVRIASLNDVEAREPHGRASTEGVRDLCDLIDVLDQIAQSCLIGLAGNLDLVLDAGITGNFEALKHFREQVVRVWRKWLGRRSQRACMTWDRMRQLLERNPLPRARILRPYSTA